MAINITEYFRTQAEVFIQNSSRPMGIISLALGEKGDVPYTVPKTSLPQILTNYVPKEQIERSVAFRTLVQKGYIRLLTAEEYSKIVTPEVQARVDAKIDEVRNKTVANSGYDGTDTHEVESDDGSADIAPRIIQLMHYFSPDAAEMPFLPSDEDIIDELSTMTMTTDDMNFVLSYAKRSVKKWAQETLIAKMSEVAEEENEKVETKKRGRKAK